MKTIGLTISTCGNAHSPSSEMMQPQAQSQRPGLQDKRAAFDPLVHGGEVIQAPHQGVEFGAVLTGRNGATR